MSTIPGDLNKLLPIYSKVLLVKINFLCITSLSMDQSRFGYNSLNCPAPDKGKNEKRLKTILIIMHAVGWSALGALPVINRLESQHCETYKISSILRIHLMPSGTDSWIHEAPKNQQSRKYISRARDRVSFHTTQNKSVNIALFSCFDLSLCV